LDYYFTWLDTVGGLVLVGSVGIDRHRDDFQNLKLPCLLVWGEKDTISPLSGAHFLEKTIPKVKLVVLDGAPHPCYLDQTDKWHQSLITFLKEDASHSL
jgi:abhydrolase domain-containing protein 14